MADLLLNPVSRAAINDIISRPPHALAVVGPLGAGKASVARYSLSKILKTPVEKLEFHPQVYIIQPSKDTISIDTVRKLQEFVKLRTTGTAQVRRGVIIENADRLTREAQNALLKLLEEPPQDTVIILTTIHEKALLPTIISRVQRIHLKAPGIAEINKYFSLKGFEQKQIEKAYYISGGQPGLMTALLEGAENHELVKIINSAKAILATDLFGRMCEVDALAKRKDELDNLIFAMQQVCHAALEKSAKDGKIIAVKKWHKALRTLQIAKDRLALNAQPKLLLTDLFLNL